MPWHQLAQCHHHCPSEHQKLPTGVNTGLRLGTRKTLTITLARALEGLVAGVGGLIGGVCEHGPRDGAHFRLAQVRAAAAGRRDVCVKRSCAHPKTTSEPDGAENDVKSIYYGPVA